MANFGTLKEQDKYIATKQVLVERDLVMALRPDLSEAARDVVIARRLAANGFSVGASFVKECRNFARTKANLQPTDECSRDEFDIAKDAFLSDLKNKQKEKTKEYKKASGNSQTVEGKLNTKRGDVSSKKNKRGFRKGLFWASVAVVGTVVLGSFGSIVGGLTQFLLGAPLAALAGVGITVMVGYMLIKRFIWPKIKVMKDATNKATKEDIDTASKDVKTLEAELASAKTKELAAEQEKIDAESKFNEVNNDLVTSYHETTPVENNLLVAIETIVNDAQFTNDLIAKDAGINEKPMRQHYVDEYKNYAICMLQHRVNTGLISTPAQMAHYTNNTRTAFSTIAHDITGAQSRVDTVKQTEMLNAQTAENVR